MLGYVGFFNPTLLIPFHSLFLYFLDFDDFVTDFLLLLDIFDFNLLVFFLILEVLLALNFIDLFFIFLE